MGRSRCQPEHPCWGVLPVGLVPGNVASWWSWQRCLRMPLQLTLLAGVCSGYLVQPSLTLMQVFRSQAWVLKIGWPCPGAVGLGGKTSSKLARWLLRNRCAQLFPNGSSAFWVPAVTRRGFRQRLFAGGGGERSSRQCRHGAAGKASLRKRRPGSVEQCAKIPRRCGRAQARPERRPGGSAGQDQLGAQGATGQWDRTSALGPDSVKLQKEC